MTNLRSERSFPTEDPTVLRSAGAYSSLKPSAERGQNPKEWVHLLPPTSLVVSPLSSYYCKRKLSPLRSSQLSPIISSRTESRDGDKILVVEETTMRNVVVIFIRSSPPRPTAAFDSARTDGGRWKADSRQRTADGCRRTADGG